MEFRKSARDLKEQSAGKERTNEVRDGGRDPGFRRPGSGLSQSPAPPGFFLVSKTCHDALSTINRDKVSVSVFVTFVTV